MTPLEIHQEIASKELRAFPKATQLQCLPDLLGELETAEPTAWAWSAKPPLGRTHEGSERPECGFDSAIRRQGLGGRP